MGLTFTASTVSAEAPDIDAGIYDARFDGVEAKTLEKSQYDPDVFEWQFTLFEEGEPLYDDGEPVEVTGLSSRSTNTKSKTTPRAVKYLKAIMSPEEWATFEAGGGVDASALQGRMVQVEVAIKDSGWPFVDNVLPGRRQSRKARTAD